MPLVPKFDGSHDMVPVADAVGRGPGAAWFQTFWEPCVGCAAMERLGARGDGGKWVCDPTMLFSSVGEEGASFPCAVLSVGSNNDFTFERAVSKEYGCLVHVYDYTSNPPDYADDPGCEWCLDRDRVVFFDKGLGDSATAASDSRFVTLGRMLHGLARAAGMDMVNLAKIDCEGCEFDAFADSATRHALRSVVQLDLEVHFSVKDHEQPVSQQRRMAQLWTDLHAADMRAFSKEPNIQFAPDCVEYAFINGMAVV